MLYLQNITREEAPMPTPLRNIRVSDDLWNAVKSKARAEGTTVTAVVVAALKRYLNRK